MLIHNHALGGAYHLASLAAFGSRCSPSRRLSARCLFGMHADIDTQKFDQILSILKSRKQQGLKRAPHYRYPLEACMHALTSSWQQRQLQLPIAAPLCAG